MPVRVSRPKFPSESYFVAPLHYMSLYTVMRQASAVRPAREAAALARKMGDKQPLEAF